MEVGYYIGLGISFASLGVYSLYNKFRAEKCEDILRQSNYLYTNPSLFTRALRDALDEYIDEVRDSLTLDELPKRRQNLLFVMDKLLNYNNSYMRQFYCKYSDNKDRIEIVIEPNSVHINIDGKYFVGYSSDNISWRSPMKYPFPELVKIYPLEEFLENISKKTT